MTGTKRKHVVAPKKEMVRLVNEIVEGWQEMEGNCILRCTLVLA